MTGLATSLARSASLGWPKSLDEAGLAQADPGIREDISRLFRTTSFFKTWLARKKVKCLPRILRLPRYPSQILSTCSEKTFPRAGLTTALVVRRYGLPYFSPSMAKKLSDGNREVAAPDRLGTPSGNTAGLEGYLRPLGDFWARAKNRLKGDFWG